MLKRIVKFLISLVVFAISAAADFLRRLAGQKPRGACVVLYYHDIPANRRARFAWQMDALLRRATPLRADVRTPLPEGERCAVVTFDDGFASVVENALPELEQRGIPSTIFVVTDALGKQPGWMESAQDSDASEKCMSVEQLQRLPAELVSIGSHTRTHPKLTRIAEADAKRELGESRTKLEGLLNRPVALFSFPFGAFSSELVHWCREAGYERVFTTLPFCAFRDSQEFVTGRVRVDPTDWPWEFELKLRGAYRWLPWAFALKRKILTRA